MVVVNFMNFKTLTISVFVVLSCQTTTENTSQFDSADSLSLSQPKGSVFIALQNYPEIQDSIGFIRELRRIAKLNIEQSLAQKEQECIRAFEKIKIFGSSREFYLVEYYYRVGSSAGFPWKYQVLFDSAGYWLGTFQGIRYELITADPKQNPYLLLVYSTAKGNGGHVIYTIRNDSLHLVLNTQEMGIQTYDKHEDMSVFETDELNLSFTDINRDGNLDIVFSGKKLMLGKYTPDSFWYDVEQDTPFSRENPASIEQVKYIFFQDPLTGTFQLRK